MEWEWFSVVVDCWYFLLEIGGGEFFFSNGIMVFFYGDICCSFCVLCVLVRVLLLCCFVCNLVFVWFYFLLWCYFDFLRFYFFYVVNFDYLCDGLWWFVFEVKFDVWSLYSRLFLDIGSSFSGIFSSSLCVLFGILVLRVWSINFFFNILF